MNLKISKDSWIRVEKERKEGKAMSELFESICQGLNEAIGYERGGCELILLCMKSKVKWIGKSPEYLWRNLDSG